MIVFYFLIDLIVCNFFPFFTCFITIDIDRNDLFDVVVVTILLSCIYGRLFVNSFVLVTLYYVVRCLNIKKKYRLLKNIVVYVIFLLVGIYL